MFIHIMKAGLIHRLSVAVHMFLGIVDGLVYIGSFTLIYTNFEMDYIGWWTKRQIMKKKQERLREKEL